MIRLIFCFLLFFALSGIDGMADLPETMTWRGQLEVKSQVLRLEVVIERENNHWDGYLLIQGKGQVPLAGIILDASGFQFRNDKIGIRYQGVFKESGSLAEGTFHQNGQSVSLNLTTILNDEGTILENWKGTLSIQRMALPMVVQIVETEPGKRVAFFRNLAEEQIYRASWQLDNGKATLSVPFIDLEFQGEMNRSGDTAVGVWRQPGRELDFTLKREPLALNDSATHIEEKAKTPTPQKTIVDQANQPQDIPAEVWDQLSTQVQAMVDNQEIVGGELLVIQNRKPIYRKAFGWKDREQSEPMPIGAVYCVRSMTKPLIGTAIHMLMDEGMLRLETPVHEIIPAFDVPGKQEITVKHLLRHTSGLPFIPVKKPLVDYADIHAVVDDIATMDLNFEPGERFLYSDAGSIVLGAIVSVMSGMPAEQFIQRNILEPLDMKETYPLIGEDETVLKRIPSAYSGGIGNWLKHWQPQDPPIFPIFLASASLFSTTTDYARFLALWMDNGTVGDSRLLSTRAIKTALTSRRVVDDYPSDFGQLRAHYGHQWIVYSESISDQPEMPEIFGHDGSDGTYAWAWPRRDLMVLFFTQSRGTLAGVNLQSSIQKWLIERNFNDTDPVIEHMPNTQRLAGLYWDETAENAYYVVKPQGDRLIIERPGRMQAMFKPAKEKGRYHHQAFKKVWVEFMHDEAGQVTGMKTSFGGKIEHDPKHVPSKDLPSADDVLARVKQAHKIMRLDDIGLLKITGQLTFEMSGMKGSFTSFIAGDKEKTEVRLGRTKELVIKHKSRAWSQVTGKAPEALDDVRLEQALLDRFAVVFGDWSTSYERVDVLKRLVIRDQSILLVRVVPKVGPGSTMYVDETSGMVMAKDGLVHIPGLGMVGVHIRYKDFRDVGGMKLPFLTISKFASNQIGTLKTTLDDASVGGEVSAETFLPPKRFR